MKWPINKVWEYQAYLLASSQEFRDKVQNAANSNGNQVEAVQRMIANMVAR